MNKALKISVIAACSCIVLAVLLCVGQTVYARWQMAQVEAAKERYADALPPCPADMGMAAQYREGMKQYEAGMTPFKPNRTLTHSDGSGRTTECDMSKAQQ